MKNNILIFFAILSSCTTYSQFKPDTSFNDNEIYIKQQLDDSTFFVKRIYKTKGETTYTKHQINDSIFYRQNIVEGKRYVKLIQFGLIDSVWVETGTVMLKDGKTISTRELNKQGTGIYRQYSEDGNVLSISELEKFKNNGKYFGFYPNGLLKEKGNFKDYLKTGEWISFAENGDTLKIENYEVKEVILLQLNQYTTDEINSFQWGGTLENELVSLRHGIFKTYINGKLESETVFVEGKMIE